MKTAINASTREIAALGAASIRGKPRTAIRQPVLPSESRRKLRAVELADGRTQLIEAGGTLFMVCATAAVAARMRAVFSS